MNLEQLRDELAVPLRAALRRERSLAARMVPSWLLLKILLWVLQLVAARLSTGRPTITVLMAVPAHDFDPILVASMEEARS